MTEAPSGSPWGPEYDDRRIHAAREHRTTSYDGPEPPFEGPLHLLSRAAWQTVLVTGVVSLVLGVLVLAWPGASLVADVVLIVSPFESVAVLTVVGGCWLIAVGVVEIVTGLRIRRRAGLVPREL
ncbi:MAG: DUF308 domain-containing protein [Streptomyces sp.]|nr:DUF308 domain-containing protein [Streptomyces sp.]